MSSYKNTRSLFEAFINLPVLVIGDVMTDAYLWGKVDRISPEAPVPVVSVHKRESRLGGAANVAINLRAMGAAPILCSVIGDDRHGQELLGLMQEIGMENAGMVSSPNRTTTVKTRIIGNNHQLLRVDDEVINDINQAEQENLFLKVEQLLDARKPAVVIFEDYDKGVLCEELIQRIIAACKKRSIPTAADPKKKNFMSYKGIDLFKPNLHELKTGLKIDLDKTDSHALDEATKSFRESHHINTLLVTLSEAGVFYAQNGKAAILPAHIRNISDVSGAGDTVISVAALCLALKIPAASMAALANLAGGLVCEKVGVVPVDKNQLLEESADLSI